MLVLAHETANEREEISVRDCWLLFLILQRSKFNPDCIEGTYTHTLTTNDLLKGIPRK